MILYIYIYDFIYIYIYIYIKSRHLFIKEFCYISVSAKSSNKCLRLLYIYFDIFT